MSSKFKLLNSFVFITFLNKFEEKNISVKFKFINLNNIKYANLFIW